MGLTVNNTVCETFLGLFPLALLAMSAHAVLVCFSITGSVQNGQPSKSKRDVLTWPLAAHVATEGTFWSEGLMYKGLTYL